MEQFRDKIPGGEHIIHSDPTHEEMMRAQGKITGFSPGSPSSGEKIWGYDQGSGGQGARQMLGMDMGQSSSKPVNNILGGAGSKKTNVDEYFSTKKKGKKTNMDDYFNLGKKTKGKKMDVNSYLGTGKTKTKSNFNVGQYFNAVKPIGNKPLNMNQFFSSGQTKKVNNNNVSQKINNMLGGQGTSKQINNMLGNRGNADKKLANMLGSNGTTNNAVNNILGVSNVNNKINNMLGIKSDTRSKNLKARNYYDEADPVNNPDAEVVDSKEEIISETIKPEKFSKIKTMFGSIRDYQTGQQKKKQEQKFYADILNRQVGDAALRKFQPKQYVLGEDGVKHYIRDGLVDMDGKYYPLDLRNTDATGALVINNKRYELRMEEGKAAQDITSTETDLLGLDFKKGRFTPHKTSITDTAGFEAVAQVGRGLVGFADKISTNAPRELSKISKTLYGDVAQQDFASVVNVATGKKVAQPGMQYITETITDKKGKTIVRQKPLYRGRVGSQGQGLYSNIQGGASEASGWEQKVNVAVPMGGSMRSVDFYSSGQQRGLTGEGIAQMTPQFTGSNFGRSVMGLQNREIPEPLQQPTEVQYDSQPQQPVPELPPTIVPVSETVAQVPVVAQQPTEYRTDGTQYTPQALRKDVTYRRGPYKKRKFIVTTPNVPVTVSAQTIPQPNQPQQSFTYQAPLQPQQQQIY